MADENEQNIGGDQGGSSGSNMQGGSDGGNGGGDTSGRTGGVSGDQGRSESPSFSIPEEYKDRGWASKIKSPEDVFKQIDSLDKLAGKKYVPFDFESSTPEQINEYLNTNRPKDPKDYDFGDKIKEEYAENVKNFFHKSGQSQYQANKLLEGYFGMQDEVRGQLFSKDGFNEKLKETFGTDYQKIAGDTANFIGGNLNKDDKAILETFTNDQLSVMYRFANNIKTQYGAKETDKGMGGDLGVVKGGDLKAERTKVFNEITALQGKPHTESQKKALLKRLSDIDSKIGSIA